MVDNRPRIAPTWLVLLLAGVVLITLYLVHPRGGLRSRMTSTDAPSDLSIAYLEAWLRVQPGNPEILSVLGTQYVRLGRNEDARRIAARMEAIPDDHLRRAAQLLRLTVDTRETFALPANDPGREAALGRLRTQLTNAAALTWSNADLQMLAEAAASVNAQQLAGQLYARLAEQDPAQQTRWNREVVRFAMYGGDYRGAANGWFRLQAGAATFDARRQCFIEGIKALQSGSLLDDALAAADQHGAEFRHDHETLVVLLNLARAAHRPDLVDRYAKALAGYAQAQPEEDGALRLVDFIRERASEEGTQGQYTYMDGPQVRGGFAMRASTHGSREVHVVRVAASIAAPASAKPAAAAPGATASGAAAAPAAASNSTASNDVPGLLYQSFLESGDLPNAQRVAAEQVSKNPGSPIWTRRLAQVAEWNHASPLALQMWLAYAQATHDPEGWKNVMRLAPMLNDDNAYLAALIQASNASPGDLKLVDSVVAAYERLGRPDDALAFLRGRQRNSPAQAIDARLGQLAERSGHDDEALAYYRKLNQLYPSNTQYALRTASLLYRHGDYKGALDTLLAARRGARDDDVLFWRNAAQLARLLQRDDIANDAYKHLLASGQAAPEDLSAMTYFYDAYPVDAARTSELQFHRDHSQRALQSAIHYYTDAGQYDRVDALLKSLTPEQLAAGEADPAFLRVRAEYYRQIDRPFDALHDLQHAVSLPGATLDLRAALLWTLVDYGSEAQLREAVAEWRDAPAQAPVLWGPLAAAQMRLNRPEAALKYLRLQSASMSRDPLWQLAYAEAQEMAGRSDLAWSIRRNVWRQMQREEAEVRANSAQGQIVLRTRASQGGEVREQMLGRRVTLASIFENADVSKAFLIDLLVSDAGRNDNTEARRTLLGDAAGLPPAQPVKTQPAKSPDQAQLTSSVARDVALAWAMSHEASPLAKRWLARQYADVLMQPSEQLIAIALAENDKPAMERLLDQQGARLPLYNRIDASIAVDRPGAAENLAFQGLEGAPYDSELHSRLQQTALTWPQSLDATVTSFVEHPLDYIEQTLAGSIKVADLYMVGVNGVQRFQHSTDESQLTNVPSVDRSVEFYARRQTYDTAFMVTAGRREALDSFYSVSVGAEWGRNSPLSIALKAGRNQTARESQALLVGGMKDNVVGTITYRATQHLYATGTVEADRFYSQARNYLGSGVLSTGEIGYRIRTNYPDFTVRLIGTHGDYGASGSADGLISRLIPASAGPVDASTFVPQTYSQYGAFFGFGNDLIDQYTRAWRPFLDVGVLHDSFQGWGPSISLGLAGTVFGGDHAALFFSHQRVSRLGTPVTQIGARYSWFY
ncbi:tetratricopeptide repeat protein [Paraburkholderia sp. BL6665CI2N2]|uniref:tetratricopeptide repeat protein n=1 Tax=Paraburkholderia sp. BL6665CI2N2 TaxID=1938806 RepID=UPI00106588DF|nr:tetratricopeptide repeat protein [Paraburkholderia sp. BL6665CI2N2]TDY26040.1 tetratricopeptide repeat protein [Paraburkholderia sp. BL6665CI2N2]